MAIPTLRAPYFDAGSVHQDMEVYDNAGILLGTVSDVWGYISPYGYLAKSKFGHSADGPVRGTAHLFEDADGYMQVRRPRDRSRDNEEDLYIPLNAVREFVSAETLRLACSEETCSIRFRRQPESF